MRFAGNATTLPLGIRRLAFLSVLLAGCGGSSGDKYVEPENPVPLPEAVPMLPSAEGTTVDLPKAPG